MDEKERITEILEAITKVARGDYSAQIKCSGENDDLDALAMGLNMMIDDIKESSQELQAAHRASLNIMEDLEKEKQELDELNKQLKMEIAERKRIEEREKKYIQDLKFLYEVAVESVALGPQKDIYQYIGEKLQELVSSSYVMVLPFDETADKFTLKEIVGEAGAISTATELLGVDPIGLVFSLNEESKSRLLRGRIYKLDAVLDKIIGIKIPKGADETLMKLIGIGDMYSMGLTRHGKLFGFVVIAMHKDVKLANPEVAETFMSYACVLLQRKMAEDALRESEERYRAFTEEALVGVYIYQEGRYKFVNPAMERITGYQRAELLKMDPHELAVPEDRPMLQKREQAIKRGEVIPYEYVVRIIRKDGSRAVLEVKAREITFEKKSAALGNCIDITERKRAEKSLQESEERFRNIAENALEWIWEVDTSGKYTYASPVVEQILGYKPGEVLEKHFYDFFHPEDREKLTKAAFEMFAQKQTFREFVNRNVHRDGKTVWLSTCGVPILDEKGDLLGYRGADTDITDRKQAEEALRASEERYRSLQANVPLGVFRSTPDGRIISVNPALVKMLGYQSAEELLKLSVADTYLDPTQRNEFSQHLTEEGKVTNFEVQLQRKDGSALWVSLNAKAVVNEVGEVLNYDGIMEDITERKQAEEREKEYLKNLKFLYDSALEFLDVVPDRDIYRYIGNKIHELVGSGLVAVASYDETTDKFTGRRVVGVGGKTDAALRLFGRNPVGFHFTIPPVSEAQLLQGKLRKIPTVLDKIKDTKIPTGSEGALKKLLGLGDIYTMGLARRERLFGFVLIVMHQGTELLNKDVVETFVNQASIVLQRSQTEEELAASLAEKEALLKEVHHRVKNNLQVISSLLNLQAGYVEDERILNMLANSQSRIESMALIHEKLYQSEDLARIDFADYLRNLARSLFASYKVTPNAVYLQIEIGDILLGIDKAIPLALIINELISNSLEHAFPGEQKGGIRVNLCEDGDKLILTVADNGVGLPKNFDFQATKSLGLRLVSMLVGQLKGSLELTRTRGTKFKITLPIKKPKPESNR